MSHDTFSIETQGGQVKARVHQQGKRVTVDMGKARYTHEQDHSVAIHEESIEVGGETFVGYRASVGNPHFVIPVQKLDAELACQYGPLIENDSRFKNRSNVQFLKVLDRRNIQIEIWERGAGYTLASGSSSTAAAAVAFGLGLCEKNISVKMPGGEIKISFDEQLFATMQGAVCKIACGEMVAEALE